MEDMCTYQIELRGQVDEQSLNATSPLQMTVAREAVDHELLQDRTLFSVYTDQAGLIGLLRHLHARGLALLSISRQG
jgi:hypothetical protein